MCEADRVSVSVNVRESICECVSMQDRACASVFVCVREGSDLFFYTQCQRERVCECACKLRGRV